MHSVHRIAFVFVFFLTDKIIDFFFFNFWTSLYAPLDNCHPFDCNCACEGGVIFPRGRSLVPI